MNKFTLIVVVIFFVIMGYLFYDSDSNNAINNDSNEKLEVNLIKPLEIDKPNEDVSNMSSQTELDFSKSPQKRQVQQKTAKAQRKESYEYPFTQEGQAFMTRGELLMQGQNKKHTDNYSPDLFKQIEQAKYNLKLSKEIAVLSKKLYVDTEEGKVMDPDVYAKINELSKNLIATVKKQQNIE